MSAIKHNLKASSSKLSDTLHVKMANEYMEYKCDDPKKSILFLFNIKCPIWNINANRRKNLKAYYDIGLEWITNILQIC